MDKELLEDLLNGLTQQTNETEWFEFKENYINPDELGQRISGLSNSVALYGKDFGYIVFGVNDKTHKIVGTTFSIKNQKVGSEELEHRLNQLISPKIDIRVHEFITQAKLPIVILEIPRALGKPTLFKHVPYIRIGSITRPLRDFQEKEKKLWSILSNSTFEGQCAMTNVSEDDVLQILSYPSYFKLTGQSLPTNKQGIIDKLLQEKFIIKNKVGRYDITNLGVILFANNLSESPGTKRKAVRVITYVGKDRVQGGKEQEGGKGYAFGFQGLVKYIVEQVPSIESIRNGLRQTNTIPEIIIRELVANAIIHQDFLETGTGPMVEIFSDRIEIMNPGKPLIDTDRFLDHSPKSRNEDLASFMRRINVCEERGSGIDKVITYCEIAQMPAPSFEKGDSFTRVTVFMKRPLNKMDVNEKIRSIYWHCCLKFVQREYMTNQSLRERFRVTKENLSIISRLIASAVKAGVIKPSDPHNTSRKHTKYIPFRA